MLFLLDNRGVPSVAQFIQLSQYATTPPKGTITAPTGNVTITAGGSVSFSGSGTNAAKYSWVFPSGSPATSIAQNPGSITFNTPGTYAASLTVIDTSGNSDPSPPTCTITVLPASPDFNITVTPSSGTVTPGQSTTFTVSVQALTGFTGAVILRVGSESGFPAGISSGGFSPASITGSGSSTLRMNTTTRAIPFALSLTITGTSGTLSHTASTTLLVNIAAPTGLKVTFASSGQVSLSWTASTGATGYHVKRSLDSGGPYVGVGCPTSTSFTDSGLSNGTTYYYIVSADYTGGPVAGGESADSGQVSATPAFGTFTPIRVNAGGPGYTDSLGQVWSADTGFSAGTVFSTTNAINGTTDASLYQTERWNDTTFQYQFSVPSGNYSVTLKYAEIYFSSNGQRIFNVNINGVAVQTNFDIVSAAGGAFTAVDVTFSVTASTTITIQLVPVIQNPKISAIQIVKTG